MNSLSQIGIRTNLQPIERAAFAPITPARNTTRAFCGGASAAFGNAATRLAAFVVKGGLYVYGNYPDIDELYPQAGRLNSIRKSARRFCTGCNSLCTKRRCTRRSGNLSFISGVGPRLGEGVLRKNRRLPVHRAIRGFDDTESLRKTEGRGSESGTATAPNSLRQGIVSFRRRPLSDLSILNRDLEDISLRWKQGDRRTRTARRSGRAENCRQPIREL